MNKIAIIGAGIGGLTTAIALKQKGISVEIFESAPQFKKAGSGINLAINAMQVFKRLGFHDEIMQKGQPVRSMNLRKKDLKVLSLNSMKKFESEFGINAIAIHRAELHQILLNQLKDTRIHLNKRLSHLEEKEHEVVLTFEDGTTHTAEVVIGADGIHSQVRKAVVDHAELRDAAQLCWRGISSTKIPNEYQEELNELWGSGNRFGFVPISKNEVYWYALIRKGTFQGKESDLSEVFADYDPIANDLIAGTPKENIIYGEIWDLAPIDKWYKGRICLIGDAGHATTPNMGQGAVQAIESAMVLSICLSEESSLEKAFSRYQDIRKEKANHVIKTSWQIGKMAHINNPLSAGFRNFILKSTPKSIMEKQNRKIVALNY